MMDTAMMVEIVRLLFGLGILGLGIAVVRYTNILLKTIVEVGGKRSGGNEWFVGVTAATIALFGILVSGIFLFMTLQINDTARQAARTAAEEVAVAVAEAAVIRVLPGIVQEQLKEHTNVIESAQLDVPAQGNLPTLELNQSESLEFVPLQVMRFQVVAESDGSTYRIDAKGENGFDSILYLFESSAAQGAPGLDDDDFIVDYDDDSGGGESGLDSQIVFTPTEGLTYFVELKEWNGEEGRSILSISLVP